MSVGCFKLYRQLGSFSRRKPVGTYSVLVKNKFGLFQYWVIESMRVRNLYKYLYNNWGETYPLHHMLLCILISCYKYLGYKIPLTMFYTIGHKYTRCWPKLKTAQSLYEWRSEIKKKKKKKKKKYHVSPLIPHPYLETLDKNLKSLKPFCPLFSSPTWGPRWGSPMAPGYFKKWQYPLSLFL